MSYGTSSTTTANAYTGYDRFGRIVETLWKTGSTDQVHSKYGRNATGNIMWRKDVKAASILSPTTQDDHYWYDGLRQVTRHDRGSLTPAGGPPYTGVGNLQQQEDWTYDETGNWKQYQSYAPSLVQTREHNVANQITEITNPAGVVQPVFDPAGNMRTMPAPGDWTKAYTCKWDAWNRLVEIREGSTLVQANSYDARTRRIRKQTAAETRDYYYDRQWRALEERVSGAVKADYVYSPTDRWNLIRRRRSVSGTLDETRFVLRDYLDPVAIITAAGGVDERYGYDAFGPVRVMDANFATRSSSTCAWNWLYHGEFLDSESGMYDYGYRFYHPALGRWASRDPIGERGGLNLYGFVGNDSVGNLDILGKKSIYDSSPIYDPTVVGWMEGDRPVDRTVGKVDATLRYPDDRCVGNAVIEFSIYSEGNLQTAGALNGRVEAIHKSLPSCSGFDPADYFGQNETNVPLSYVSQSKSMFSENGTASGSVSIPLECGSGHWADSCCDVCKEGKITIASTGAAKAAMRPDYNGRWVAIVIDYKVELKSSAIFADYNVGCKYQIDGSELVARVYGPQNTGFR